MATHTQFGSSITAARRNVARTQVDVASCVGISQGTLSDIETGVSTTTPATARAICAELGLGPPWPAFAWFEARAAADARELGTTPAEALAALARELTRALAEYEAQAT